MKQLENYISKVTECNIYSILHANKAAVWKTFFNANIYIKNINKQ